MSHLVCPLCGKNAPISTLDPEGLDLDLRVVSFRGLGRGKGFAKSEEHSILGDGEYSPIIAARVVELCGMFLESGELKKETLIDKFGLTSLIEKGNESKDLIDNLQLELATERQIHYDENARLLSQLDQLKKDNDYIKYELNSTKEKIRKITSSEEIKSKVDYILSVGLDLQKARIMDMDESEWCVNLSKETPEFIIYLRELVPKLSNDLRASLLERVKTDDATENLIKYIWNQPRTKTVADILEFGSLREVFIHGERREFHSLPSASNHTLTIEELKKVVLDARKVVPSVKD